MSKNYILQGKEPKQADDVLEWAQWMSTNDRAIVVTRYNNVTVSTVFLGIDHAWMSEQPILFETMVFGGKYDHFQDRYYTWDEAVKGHKAACKMVRGNFMSRLFRSIINKLKKLWTK